MTVFHNYIHLTCKVYQNTYKHRSCCQRTLLNENGIILCLFHHFSVCLTQMTSMLRAIMKCFILPITSHIKIRHEKKNWQQFDFIMHIFCISRHFTPSAKNGPHDYQTNINMLENHFSLCRNVFHHEFSMKILLQISFDSSCPSVPYIFGNIPQQIVHELTHQSYCIWCPWLQST